MPGFAADFQRTLDTAKTVGTFGAVSTTQARRGRLVEINFGSEATPVDAAILWRLRRYTAAGTSTAVVPQATDGADAAFLGQAGENHTVEPTYTAAAILLHVPLNQRATYRWIAVQGRELIYPATTANGIGIETPTSTSGTPAVTVQTQLDE